VFDKVSEASADLAFIGRLPINSALDSNSSRHWCASMLCTVALTSHCALALGCPEMCRRWGSVEALVLLEESSPFRKWSRRVYWERQSLSVWHGADKFVFNLLLYHASVTNAVKIFDVVLLRKTTRGTTDGIRRIHISRFLTLWIEPEPRGS